MQFKHKYNFWIENKTYRPLSNEEYSCFSSSSQIIDYLFLSNKKVFFDRMGNSCVAWLPALACKHLMKVSFYPILIPRCLRC